MGNLSGDVPGNIDRVILVFSTGLTVGHQTVLLGASQFLVHFFRKHNVYLEVFSHN